MRSKKRLSGRQLCVILDSGFLGRDRIVKVALEACRAGADMIQLRCKALSTSQMLKVAKKVSKIARAFKKPFIINDRLEVALASNADGLHIGQGDINISMARKFLGGKKIIGVSTQNKRAAAAAKNNGADYIGVGPVFATPVKKHLRPTGLKLKKDIRRLDIPLFAIGGIGPHNIGVLTRSGFSNAAVIRAICESRNPFAATRKLKEALILS